MSDSPLLLGIDLGSSRLKAALFDSAGECIREVTVPTPFVRRADGAEMLPEALLSSVHGALVELGEQLGRVAAVGIASMGEVGTVVEPGGGFPDMPMLAWYDDRGSTVARRLNESFGVSLTALIGRAMRPATTVAKLGWVASHGTDRVAGTFLGVAGLLLWRLTGEMHIEASLACTTGAFDPWTRAFDADITRAVGLDDLHWPPLSHAGEAAPVTTEGSQWSGLPVGTPVTLAGHDHPVGAIGAGGGPADVVDSMGTGEPLLRELMGSGPDDRAPIPSERLTVTCWPGTRHVGVLWEDMRPGVALDTFLSTLPPEWTRARLEREPAAEEDNPIRPAVRSYITAPERGLPREMAVHRPSLIYSWLLTELAEAAAEGVDELEKIGPPIERVILIGGGTRSARWVRAKTAANRHPTFLAGHGETVLRGAALFAGRALDWWSAADDCAFRRGLVPAPGGRCSEETGSGAATRLNPGAGAKWDGRGVDGMSLRISGIEVETID